MLTIYERQPGVEVLARFAFEQCPTVGQLRVCFPDGGFLDYAYREMRGVQRPPDNERTEAMSLSTGYLWELMQSRQQAWKQANPNAEMTFA